VTTPKKPDTTSSSEIVITELQRGQLEVFILGTSPLICNRMSEKVQRELLAPRKRTAADKESTMKHSPLTEFRASPYRMADPNAPTLLAVLPTMFKRAMGTAALDTPGAKKAQIGRLVNVDWDKMPVWGVPKLMMSVTRSADINRTPDIRTRAVIPEWACRLIIRFQKPILREQGIVNLLAAAGELAGIGDWRQEKGSGSFGAFRIVGSNDKDWMRIVRGGGRAAQQNAMDDPVPFDDETSDLLAWFTAEEKRRGFKAVA